MKLYGLQMTRNLNNFLRESEHKQYAVQKGTDMHTKMQKIVVDSDCVIGDTDIVNIIKKRSDLVLFFNKNAKTEVSVVGYICGTFISRRIDRLFIDDKTKTVYFIDYKTDVNKTEFINKYKQQLNEYAQLLHSAYPDYKINGYILWLNDWELYKLI